MRTLCTAVVLFGALVATGYSQSKATPSWNTDVAPIILRHCTPCHRPGGSVAISFATYDEARPYADAIARRVWARTMPPWYVDPQYGKNFTFSNRQRPTDLELQILIAWAKAGAPMGDQPAASTADVEVNFTGIWTLKHSRAGRVVLLEVARRQNRYVARIGTSSNVLHEADGCTVENGTIVVRDGALTYRLETEGNTITGTVAGPGNTEPVTGTKQKVLERQDPTR